MHKQESMATKMQKNKESQIGWYKTSIASTKGRARHVIRHIERLTWETLTS